MKKNNKGYSLVELLAVIAIMAIMTGAAGLTINLVAKARVKSTAQAVKSAIENTRTQAVSRGDGTLTIYMDSDENVCVKQDITNGPGGVPAITEEAIGNSAITVTYVIGGETKTLDADNPIVISFDPGSGSFKTGAPSKITISGAGRTYTITCYQLTGKIKMD